MYAGKKGGKGYQYWCWQGPDGRAFNRRKQRAEANPRTKQLMRLFYPHHTAQETSEAASIIYIRKCLRKSRKRRK